MNVLHFRKNSGTSMASKILDISSDVAVRCAGYMVNTLRQYMSVQDFNKIAEESTKTSDDADGVRVSDGIEEAGIKSDMTQTLVDDRKVSDRYSAGDRNIISKTTRNNSFNEAEDGDAENCLTCDVDPYQMIARFLNDAENRRRSISDPYRVTRRPSKKTVVRKVAPSLSMDDIALQKPTIGVLGRGHKNNNIPVLKISLQTFASSKQVRVIVTELSNADQIFQGGSTREPELELCLSLRRSRHFKTKHKIKEFSSNKLPKMLYFFNIDFEKFYDMQLRFQLYEKQSDFWRRKEKIGEAYISFAASDFTFETTIWCWLLCNNNRKESIPNNVFEVIN